MRGWLLIPAGEGIGKFLLMGVREASSSEATSDPTEYPRTGYSWKGVMLRGRGKGGKEDGEVTGGQSGLLASFTLRQ